MGLEDNNTQLKAHVEAFLANLRRRGKAARTITRWSVELDRFVAWVGDRELHEIDAGALELGFLSEWEAAFRDRNGRGPALNSTRAVIQAVRSFYAFLDRFGLLADRNGGLLRNPALALELPVIPVKPELDWLRAEEDGAFLLCPMNAREDIVIFLLRMTGLRLGEALALTNRDVDVGAGSITVTTSKTVAGLRSVPISPELRPHIERWWAFTRREGLFHPDGAFLVTRNSTAMKPQYVEQVVARVAARAGLTRRVTPHTLRRTFGSDLVNRRVRLEVVSRLLGHAPTSITEKAYARLEDATVRGRDAGRACRLRQRRAHTFLNRSDQDEPRRSERGSPTFARPLRPSVRPCHAEDVSVRYDEVELAIAVDPAHAAVVVVGREHRLVVSRCRLEQVSV